MHINRITTTNEATTHHSFRLTHTHTRLMYKRQIRQYDQFMHKHTHTHFEIYLNTKEREREREIGQHNDKTILNHNS
jgi:hypothetical protein